MENDRSAPATKGDIDDVKREIADLKQDVKQEIAMVRSEMQHSFDHLTETMRDGQTELLKAFYGYTQSNNERVQAAESEAASLKKRLGIVEARITDVERRLMTPPPQ
jgi:predicted  nucleic acid-binding Zn-ribbon protein